MYKGNQAQQAQDNIPQQRGNINKITLSYQRMLIHFKNCLHDGYFNQIFKREGPGITILDNGSVVIGNFKNDQNIGVCLIFITTDTYFIGQFNKGVLDGSFVIRSPDTTIYSSFTNNKIQGELLLIDYQNWAAYLWSIQNNGEGQIIKQMSLGEIMNSYMSYEQIKRIQKNISSKLDKTKFIPQQSLIIKAMAPYIQIIPNISQFIKSAKKGSNQFQGMGPQIFSHKIFQNNQILLLNSNNVNEFLGVVLNKKQELIAFGQFKQFEFEKISAKDKLLTYEYTYILNGIGTKIENLQNQSKKNRAQETTKVIYSGQFIKHQLNGQGCKYVVGQKSIYGKFVDGNLRHADKLSKTEGCSFYDAEDRTLMQNVLLKRLQQRSSWDQLLTNKNLQYMCKVKFAPKMLEIFKKKGYYFVVFEKPTGPPLSEPEQVGKLPLHRFYSMFFDLVQSCLELKQQSPQMYILPEWVFVHRNTVRIGHFQPFFSNEGEDGNKHVFMYNLEKSMHSSLNNKALAQSDVLTFQRRQSLIFNLGAIAYQLITGKKATTATSQQQYATQIAQLESQSFKRIQRITKDQKLAEMISKMIKQDPFDCPTITQIFNFTKRKNIQYSPKDSNNPTIQFDLQKIQLTDNSSSPQQLVQSLRKLQFQLNIYFCIYNIHPCTPGSSKKNQVDKSSAEAFKRYIDAKGPEVSQQSQLLTFFALPYIPKPQQNPSMAKVFTKQWVQRLRVNLNQALRQFTARNTANSNKQNKKTIYLTTLHEIYERFLQNNVQMSRIKSQQSKQGYDQKVVEKYERQIQEITLHNKQMISYIDILQQNLKDLNQVSKTNLVQSNRKWFQFSKQILQLTKKALKGENVKDRLQTYERFFGTNIEELIYCTDEISLFEKNSYTEDASMIPGSRNANNRDRTSNNHGVQIAPIDLNKISNLFAQADRPQYQLQICLVLKALKQRLCYHKNAYLRRQVVVSYQRNDLCALKQVNYHIQKKLLLESSEKVKQFYLRLMNYISTDDLGNQYLSASEKLIQNLMGLMGTTTQQIPYRKHVIGILQKLSFLKQSQLMMISFGIIPMIFKIFRNEGESLHDNTIQYLMGLIMNLAVRKQSIINFQKHKTEILQILMKFIKVDDNQVKGYVNGTLYVLLQLQSIKKQALQKYKIKESLIALLNQSNRRMQSLDSEDADGQNCIIRQYTYILERLNQPNSNSIEVDNFADYDDDEDEQFAEDLEDAQILSESQSNSSEIIDGEDRSLSGQELLMKKYALLGPQAVRQQIINRSILDQTGRKSNNMTTSINHSKRIDKVFHKTQRPETPSLLPGSLDLSMTPNR